VEFRPPHGFDLRPYQADAIRAWSKAGGKGIFAMTEADATLQRETEASHDRIDTVCSELAHKDNRIHELQSENQRLLNALVEEKSARKALEIVIAKQIPEISPPQQADHPIQTI
jgi:predicted  nucleic acid-binding Zn-ribbon protein